LIHTLQLNHDPKPGSPRALFDVEQTILLEARLYSRERNSEDHEMKSTNGLATNRRLIELAASLDIYIEERRHSGAPATREDLVNWCGQNNMPLGSELKRVGRMLKAE
jgi:hypothetical protein